jgi:hypothetical protein
MTFPYMMIASAAAAAFHALITMFIHPNPFRSFSKSLRAHFKNNHARKIFRKNQAFTTLLQLTVLKTPQQNSLQTFKETRLIGIARYIQQELIC